MTGRRDHTKRRCLLRITLATAVLAGVGCLVPSFFPGGTPEAAQSRAVLEMQQRAREHLAEERFERFVEDTFSFFEISGELVSFRVHPGMTQSDVDLLDERAEELEDHVDSMLDYLGEAVPFVRGETEVSR